MTDFSLYVGKIICLSKIPHQCIFEALILECSPNEQYIRLKLRDGTEAWESVDCLKLEKSFQSARSGRQNIAEGSMASAHQKNQN